MSVQPEKGQKTLISAKFIPIAGVFKVAVITPKSVARSAVERNRLRRAVYRAVMSLPVQKNQGIVVFFVRSIPEKPLTTAFVPWVRAVFDKISTH